MNASGKFPRSEFTKLVTELCIEIVQVQTCKAWFHFLALTLVGHGSPFSTTIKHWSNMGNPSTPEADLLKLRDLATRFRSAILQVEPGAFPPEMGFVPRAYPRGVCGVV